MGYLYLFLAIVSEVIGTTALKLSEGFTRFVPGAVVVAGYGLAFFFLSLVLKTIPVGVAYAIWSGLGIVLISLIGRTYFHQTLDVPAWIGMGLILCGIVVMNLFSKTVER